MSKFRVFLEAGGLDIPASSLNLGPSKRIAGFYTTRIVEAGSESEAARQATAGVAAEWSHGKYAHVGASPIITVSEVRSLSWFACLRARNTGLSFYPHDEPGPS